MSTDSQLICDDLLERAKRGQPAIIANTLKSGIPITYRDDQGNLVQKNPDGTILILKDRQQK